MNAEQLEALTETQRTDLTFTLDRDGIDARYPYSIKVRENGDLTDIYECNRKALPWFVRSVMRRGAEYVQ